MVVGTVHLRSRASSGLQRAQHSVFPSRRAPKEGHHGDERVLVKPVVVEGASPAQWGRFSRAGLGSVRDELVRPLQSLATPNPRPRGVSWGVTANVQRVCARPWRPARARSSARAGGDGLGAAHGPDGLAGACNARRCQSGLSSGRRRSSALAYNARDPTLRGARMAQVRRDARTDALRLGRPVAASMVAYGWVDQCRQPVVRSRDRSRFYCLARALQSEMASVRLRLWPQGA